ncbi:calcium binding EGF domain protein [Ancylostoma caninum]|uniref:Calcium binding EGF domain protein n=1 Tax=Ancylostoma caninum TaxID=29170 RepID=A0A368FNT1_ANCCA|nr:calcium binding EGF domain protein [Ancylostoma caninum]
MFSSVKLLALIAHVPDVDECREQVCHKNAVCTNTPGRYFCQCGQGFSGDGVTECVASFLFPSDGHQPLPKSKTSKILWQLKSPMKLFGNLYDRITVTTSGLLSLTDVSRASGEKLEEMKMTGIAPFFAPIDTSRGGHVTVAEVTDSETLTRVTRSIQENYDEPSFQAKSVLIVTYMNVTDGKAPVRNI